MDRSGYARGTQPVRETCAVPNPDPRPELTMDDMGHGDHAAHGQAAATPAPGHDAHAGHGGHSAMDHGQMNHAAMGHGSDGSRMRAHPASETNNPLVDMQTMMPVAKLDDPGIGLRANGRRVLTYADLRSAFADPDGREPGRTIELHLTGHMGASHGRSTVFPSPTPSRSASGTASGCASYSSTTP